MASEIRNIRREVLPNGIVVITERMEHVRSVSVGVWIGTGSRQEPAELNGVSHFIEHMVFKGTERRSAEEIARSVDRVGGMLDAFTTKEMISFNAKVLDEHVPVAFDVISDLVLRPRFDSEDIQKEKSVVLEEIKMEQDNPEYLVYEIFTQNFWREHPLGKPILGTRETVARFERAAVLDCFRSWYAPHNMLITAAGHLEHEKVVALVAAQFSALRPVSRGPSLTPPEPSAQLTTRLKSELEQVHICVGVPGYPATDERRYALAVLNNILGGGMSSRLFQNIREKHGLAYSVYSDLSPYRDAGLMSVYAGTSLENAEKVIRMIICEFRSMKEELVTEEELRRAKDHLKGSMMLALESTSARMSNLARQEMYFQRFFTLDELIESIEQVSSRQLQEIARDFFRPEQIAVTVLGNLDGLTISREQLDC
jgi:predicted Zn-dependent peptidase